MSDDERALPAAELTPAPEPDPAPAAPVGALPADTESVSEPAPAPEPEPEPEPGPAPALLPAAPKAPNKAVAFVKANVAVIVLAVLLVGAVVWGVLGTVSAGDWESRATSLSAKLTTTEKSLADAEAAVEDLRTAKSRAEATATACIGAIDDADTMLEVSEKLGDKNITYVEGLNDFLAAVDAGDVAAAETIGAEMDKLTVQIQDLSVEIEEHIEAYGDSAEGCHVDDAQDV